MSNLDLIQFIGSTSRPTGTKLAYSIQGIVVPDSQAMFTTISASKLQLNGSFSIMGLKIMDGDLEVIDQGNGSTVTVGYNLKDGDPFITATFDCVVVGSTLELTRKSVKLHQTELDPRHITFVSMLMMISKASIQPVAGSGGTNTQISATSDGNILTITADLVPA